MQSKRTLLLAWCVLAGLTPVFAAKKQKPSAIAPAPEAVTMTAAQKALHAVNRLTWGPQPGAIDEVSKAGVEVWIERQLHPESIAENPVLAEKLSLLDTLTMSPEEMAQRYPPPQILKAMIEGRTPWPSNPQTRALVKRLADRQKANEAGQGDSAAAEKQPREKPEEVVARLEPLSDDEQIAALSDVPPGMLQRMYTLASPRLRRKVQQFTGSIQVVNQDLVQAKLLRAVYSNRQLEDVLTDFWFNHFNVFLDKGGDRYMVTAYERDVIRPHVLGKFGDLLLATAESPAMLFYLDNWQSTAPDNRPRGRRVGLNENYGRELMELHTLGVDGGYTQADVTEVARCFTGWSLRDVRLGGEFFFNPKMHDNGEKHVLGVTIPADGGMQDGLKVLDILTHHPSTAHFISQQLAIRFVSDNPPASLVDTMARTFTSTDGDLRAVLETMFRTPEFWQPANFRSRLKSPLEMVVSAIRATGADVDHTFALAGTLGQMGEPLYRKTEPTGYSNRGADWMNSASLVARMNFANVFARNRFPGLTLDAARLPDASDDIAHMVLGQQASAATRSTLLDSRPQGADDETFVPARDKYTRFQPPAVPAGAPTPAQITAGILLGSPDFQRK
jgi:uncharacterized protein (DUF1800 family)